MTTRYASVWKTARELSVPVVIAATALLARHVFMPSMTQKPPSEQEWLSPSAAANVLIHRISIKGVDLGKSAYSLVLIASPICQYCMMSQRFYRTLPPEAKRHAIPLIVLLPKRPDGSGYLRAAGLRDAKVRSWSDLSIHVRVTPRLMLVDSRGVVQGIWDGLLSLDEEASVIAALDRPAEAKNLADAGNRLPSTDIDVLTQRSGVTVIDIRERELVKSGLEEGVVNMPLAEIEIRAPLELDEGGYYGVDCAVVSKAECEAGVELLVGQGFKVQKLGVSKVSLW